MAIRASDIIPISEARARLTALAEAVVGGAEKVLTKQGAAYVALVDARKLDDYHGLEADYAKLMLLGDALAGLQAVAHGEVLDEDELDRLLDEPLHNGPGCACRPTRGSRPPGPRCWPCVRDTPSCVSRTPHALTPAARACCPG